MCWQKRKADDIRDFERAASSQNNNNKPAKKTEDKLGYEARKQINRNISRLEKKIDKLEKEIADIHKKLIDPDFYNSPDSAQALKNLKTYESDLESATEEWETWVTKLEDD